MKRKSFVPKDLKSHPVQPGFYGISHQLYKSANTLLTIAQNDHGTYSFHILSSVILFAATLESFLNETLTVNLLAGKYSSREMIETLILGTNMSFPEKIRNVFLVYDRNQKGIDINGDTYRDLVALVNLRNRIVHYNPDWENIYNYPKELERIVTRNNLDLENAGWTVNFSNVAIGQWAKLTVKNTLNEFSTITGAFNPFTNKEEFKSTRWED